MALLRAKIRWTIPGAGTAFTVLHFASVAGAGMSQAIADEVATKCNAYITAIKAYIPNVVTLQLVTDIEEIADTDGGLVQVFSVTSTAAAAGTASATAGWAAPTGAVITWGTGTIRNGRRIRGRSFIVPLSNEVYDVDGTLKSTPLTGITNAANALRTPGTNAKLAIFGRPTGPGATDGVKADVISHRVPDMAAILTSRRS